MASEVFLNALNGYGILGLVPSKGIDQDVVVSLINLLQAKKCNKGLVQMEDLANRYLGDLPKNSTAVCLSCTELSLVFPEHLNSTIFKINGITYINTMLIHIKAAFDYAISESA